MADLKRDKEKGFVAKFKSMDKLSKSFIVGFVIAGFVLTGLTVKIVYRAEKAYLKEVEYEDPSANFILVPPKGWTATTPGRSDVEKTITETTNGLIFDVSKYSLKSEIVPVVLVEDVVDSREQGVSGSSFISVALRGFNESKDRLYDKAYCKEYLGGLLNELKVSNVEYTEALSLLKKPYNGFLVSAKAEDKGVSVYYTQYQEVVGGNVLTLTFGTTNSEYDGKEYIRDVLKYLSFKVLSEEEFMMDVITSLGDGDLSIKSKEEDKEKISTKSEEDKEQVVDKDKDNSGEIDK